MNKKYLLGLMSLLCITGCTCAPSLEYDGDEIIHLCSEEEIALFDDNVFVELDDEQSFVVIDNDNELIEYKKEKVKFNKKENLNIKSCMFVSYDDIEDNKFGTASPIIVGRNTLDKVEVSMYGTYSYKVKDVEKYINYYGSDEPLFTAIRTSIISFYSKYLNDNYTIKSLDELLLKDELTYSELKYINENLSKYGIEVTEVDIESAKKVNK